MKLFDDYSIETFNIVTGTDLKQNMTFQEVIDERENEDVNYFYVSMCQEDVLDAIDNEKEIAELLDLRFIFIEELGIYIATY